MRSPTRRNIALGRATANPAATVDSGGTEHGQHGKNRGFRAPRAAPVRVAGAAALTVVGGAAPALAHAQGDHGSSTATPIKHLVVIFDENVSFDHYFGTYPKAANTDGTKFTADQRTPEEIDNLRTPGC